MTIKKGESWGHRVKPPSDLMVFDDDAKANEYLSRQFIDSSAVQGVAIKNSNLARALGLKGSVVAETMLATTFDLVQVKFLKADSITACRFFLGHAIIRKNMLRNKIIGVFNTSFVGKQDWAPRAHPNDGKIDLLTVNETMSVRQRLAARRLLKSGSHMPHPQIKYSQTNEFSVNELRSAALIIDGIDFGPVESCEFQVISDAVTLYW